MIEPVFEELARTKAKAEGQQVAFVKVDLGVGMGSAARRRRRLAFSWVGPRCVCGGWLGLFSVLRRVWVQIHELKGVNAPELRTQVDLLLYQAFPRKLIFGCASNERYIDV
jgi:hypothetical protein